MFVISSFLEAQNTTNNKIKTIVIDPGHGGKDPGTMGTKRYNKYEKDIALSVSIKLGEYISNAFPRVKVVYTRKKDVFLELNERTKIANNLNADLFISVHCDGFTNSIASGSSVFVMGMSKLQANLEIAIRENSVIYLEDNYQQKYDGFDPESPESYIVFNLMQNTFLDQSLQLAEQVEQQFATRANRKSRGVKQAPFYVISRTKMPSILIECGFLTNHKEEDFLHSEKGQDDIASAIFSAFKSYKESVEGVGENDNQKEKRIKQIKTEIKQEISNPEPITSNLDKVVFKVQIGTYLKSMLSERLFIDIKAEEDEINGTFKYYVGEETDKNKADILKIKMRTNGFKGAFIVAFYKDRRISMKEAVDLQTKMNYHE